MYENRIAADRLTVAMMEGFPPSIDALSACNLAGHGFLRAAWYRGNGQPLPHPLPVPGEEQPHG